MGLRKNSRQAFVAVSSAYDTVDVLTHDCNMLDAMLPVVGHFKKKATGILNEHHRMLIYVFIVCNLACLHFLKISFIECIKYHKCNFLKRRIVYHITPNPPR